MIHHWRLDEVAMFSASVQCHRLPKAVSAEMRFIAFY